MTELSQLDAELTEKRQEIEKGGKPKYHEVAKERGKMFVRERLDMLLDDGLEVEEGRFANVNAGDLPADGVVNGFGKMVKSRGGPRARIVAQAPG